MPAQPITRAYTGLTTTGVQPGLAAAGIWHKYAVQVKGIGGTLTSWSVTLDGSLDNANWTALITHAATDGSTQWAVDKPCCWIRANVGALALGTATSISVWIAAMGN